MGLICKLKMGKLKGICLENEIVNELIYILNAYVGKTELLSNQGQALDGYSALAAFIDLAKRARTIREND